MSIVRNVFSWISGCYSWCRSVLETMMFGIVEDFFTDDSDDDSYSLYSDTDNADNADTQTIHTGKPTHTMRSSTMTPTMMTPSLTTAWERLGGNLAWAFGPGPGRGTGAHGGPGGSEGVRGGPGVSPDPPGGPTPPK